MYMQIPFVVLQGNEEPIWIFVKRRLSPTKTFYLKGGWTCAWVDGRFCHA